MVDIIQKKSERQFVKQEKFIIETLNLNEQESPLSDRTVLAKYIADIEIALMSENHFLFPKREEITPINMYRSLDELIQDCQEISDMATTMAPQWCYEKIKFFLIAIDELLIYGDSSFKQNGVYLKRIILAAQERHDMAAIADLFSGECKSYIRYLINLMKSTSAKNEKNAGKH